VHINNVNTDIPIEVSVRFPRMPEKRIWTDPATRALIAGLDLPDKRLWTVRDPVSEAYYTHDGGKAVWGNEDLKKGLVLSIDKRSEAWLLLSPTGADFKLEPDQKISGEAIRSMPERWIKKVHLSKDSIKPGSSHVIYLKTGSLGYKGTGMNTVIGTSVYGIERDGENDKKLFGTKGNCWSPAWSPDGKRVAFSCYVNGKGQIYVMNADGSIYNASSNDFCDNSPAWSPDGKKITVVSERDADWEIYVMNANGSQQKRLTKSAGIDRAPSWSPDGNRIAFESDREGDFDIYLMNADGSDQRSLIARAGRNEYEPTWSPDGKQIACTTGALGAYAGDLRDIWIVNAKDGSNSYPRGLIFAAAAKNWWHLKNIHSICWSPDGKWIAGSSGGGIFLVSSDGKNFRELVSKGGISPYPGGLGAGLKLIGGWYFTGSASPRHVPKTFSGVSWSPDGEKLVFSSNMDESGYFFVYTIPAVGGTATKMEDTRSPFSHFPVWCPNPAQ
jgi:Tol biopolymer transport system component